MSTSNFYEELSKKAYNLKMGDGVVDGRGEDDGGCGQTMILMPSEAFLSMARMAYPFDTLFFFSNPLCT